MYSSSDFKLVWKKSELILPNQQQYDFLLVMRKVFQYSRWFGVSGYGKPIWRIMTLVLIAILFVIEGISVWKFVKIVAGWAVDTSGDRSVTARLSGTLFYSISIISTILCSRLSHSWQRISKYWASVERAVAIDVQEDLKLKRRMIFISIGIVFCSLLECLWRVVAFVGFDCPLSEMFERYMLLLHGFILLDWEYSNWYGIPLFYLTIARTILWTLHDLLIILISIGLASRYKRLNKYVANVCEKENKGVRYSNSEAVKIYTWRRIREAYVKQALLVREMDKELGGIIMLSIFCNFYFICFQLFMGLTQSHSSIFKRMYSFGSLGWWFVRVSGVVLAASDINSKSKAALKYIYSCDANSYNIEVMRLQGQLSKDRVALSGKGFFILNRNMLLQMFASIITYELILLQYDSS